MRADQYFYGHLTTENIWQIKMERIFFGWHQNRPCSEQMKICSNFAFTFGHHRNTEMTVIEEYEIMAKIARTSSAFALDIDHADQR